ncbi:MAG TPA: HEPN domain-containing protein [Bacteroidales bacterium]|nr:HEPN domain-containing protein [Bacteroidales bacterium]
MNALQKEYIHQWIQKANEDKLAIQRLIDPEIVSPSVVCFHCEQMAEKYLKAFLIFHGKEVIKTHNIEFLLSECASINSDFSSIDPLNLSDFGVSVRYPGDQYIPSEKEVLECKEIAFEIERIVLLSLKLSV